MKDFEKYSILFDSFAEQNGFADLNDLPVNNSGLITVVIPDGCRPNNYTATIFVEDTTGVCGDVSIPINFDVYYSSSLMQAKFDNTLTVYDAEHNGGYTFVDNKYRWYKNNELLPNDSSSYIYLGDDEFAASDCYYLEVTRKDDGVVMRSCEICPGGGTAVEDVFDRKDFLPITLFEKGQRIVIENLNEGVVGIYTLTGQLLDMYNITADNSSVVAPSKSGTYILRVVAPDYSISYKIQVR